MQIAAGKTALRCPDCEAGVKDAVPLVHQFPKVKYAMNYHRSREYTDQEKRTPARKPKW